LIYIQLNNSPRACGGSTTKKELLFVLSES